MKRPPYPRSATRSPSPSGEGRGEGVRDNLLSIRNGQRTHRIELRLFRRITLVCLRELLGVQSFELGIQFVNAAEMTRLNEQHLRHAGSTDVITFDYVESASAALFGDIYVCVDEAVIQAKRFRTSVQEELVRYIVHGILHLLGYDDRTASLRAKMKRLENKLVTSLAARFPEPRPGRSGNTAAKRSRTPPRPRRQRHG